MQNYALSPLNHKYQSLNIDIALGCKSVYGWLKTLNMALQALNGGLMVEGFAHEGHDILLAGGAEFLAHG